MAYVCGFAALDKCVADIKRKWIDEFRSASFTKRREMARDYKSFNQSLAKKASEFTGFPGVSHTVIEYESDKQGSVTG